MMLGAIEQMEGVGQIQEEIQEGVGQIQKGWGK